MLVELIVASAMVLLTVVIHGVGLGVLGHVLRVEDSAKTLGWLSVRGVAFTVGLVLGLFVLHGLEIWLYALLFHMLDAVPDLRTAVYFSTTTYGAIGYDDSAMAEPWRLVSGIEGINGLILIGWSTAFFVTVMSGRRLRCGRQR